jgi:hypothetical protein
VIKNVTTSRSLWRFGVRLGASLLSASVFYTVWMGVFISLASREGSVLNLVLWLAAPVVTSAGFAVGLILLRRRDDRHPGVAFAKACVAPLVGCAVGAGAVFPFGPMLIVFGMFVVGTTAVAIDEYKATFHHRDDQGVV